MGTNLNFSYLSVSFLAKLASCYLLTIIADLLFFKHEIGWTAGIFTLLLAAFYIIHTRPVYFKRHIHVILLLISGQAIALIENPNSLSYSLITAGFIAIAYYHQKIPYQYNIYKFLHFALVCIFKSWLYLFKDCSLFLKYRKKRSKISFATNSIVANSLFITCLSAIFIMLFSYANPVLDGWLKGIELQKLAEFISIYRMAFWFIFASIIWAVIRPRKIRQKNYSALVGKLKTQNFVLTNTSITIALAIFNIIFLMQNLMDIEYLWLGAKLPNGMTYAQYAHSGAYPLMATAIVSIIFILVVLKPERGCEQSVVIRNLIFIWVVQNIFLTMGSVQRTLIYIDIYNLTLLRISAIIWMALVACGFILIILRIANGKSNLWLVNYNFITLIATLYICSFVNFGGIIAEYNATHSKQMGGSNLTLDYRTLNLSNIESLPAIIKLNRHGNLSDVALYGASQRTIYGNSEKWLRQKLEAQQQNWRSWTFRNYRIQNQIEDMR